MSKLNPGAFSFVPGRGLVPQPSQNQPLERPEQTEVPRPAPTISLNIGGTPSPSAPAPVTSATQVTQPERPSRPPQGSEVPPQTKKTDIPASTKISKTFTMERAKTDTNAIAQEVKAVADRAVLEDLYGTCKYDFMISTTSKL